MELMIERLLCSTVRSRSLDCNLQPSEPMAAHLTAATDRRTDYYLPNFAIFASEMLFGVKAHSDNVFTNSLAAPIEVHMPHSRRVLSLSLCFCLFLSLLA